jgi:hypothetical protein
MLNYGRRSRASDEKQKNATERMINDEKSSNYFHKSEALIGETATCRKIVLSDERRMTFQPTS